MKVMKRWIPGICTEGPFEGCPVLNDEFDGTFYIIEDTQDNVAHLCDKLNTSCTDAEQFNEYLTALKDIDMPFGNIENFKETNHVAIFGDGILAYITYIAFTALHPETKLTIYGVDKNKLTMFKGVEARTYDEYKNEKYDTMIEIVGGKYSADAINKMIDWATVGADLILMGVSEEKVPLNTRLVLEKGLALKGVTRSDKKDFETVAKLLEDKEVQNKLKPMVISETEIKSVIDIYHCYEADINNKTIIGKNLMKW